MMKRREEGYIGELIQSKDTEMERTCLVISQVIKKGAFTLEQALELYEVPMDVYLSYTIETLAKEFNQETTSVIGESFHDKKWEISLRASVMSKLFEIFFLPSLLEDANDKKNYQVLQSDLKKLIKAS